MPTAWHPKRWWNFCVSEDKKKEIKLIFTEGLYKSVRRQYMKCGYWNILPLEVLKHFEPKIYKDFELYQVFMYNFYAKLIKIFWQLFWKIRKFLSKNVLIPADQNISQGAKWTICQHKQLCTLEIHLSTYGILFCKLKHMSAYETILHNINPYVNILNIYSVCRLSA